MAVTKVYASSHNRADSVLTFLIVSDDTSKWQDMKYSFIHSRNAIVKHLRSSRRKRYLQDKISSLSS